MSLDYIRGYYGVPAKRLGRVEVDGRPGVICGARGQYLAVRFDGDRSTTLCHPRWRVTYLPVSPSLPEEVQP